MRETRAICIREHQISLQHSSKQLIEDKISLFGVGRKFRILESYIETPFGGVIIFQGMKKHTGASIKSFEGFDIAWVEEAQAMSKRSIDLLYPTIRKPKSELWFSWNPEKPTDPVEVFFAGLDDLEKALVTVTYRDNPWLPEVVKVDMERDRRRDPDKYKNIWLGGYNTKSSARVFRNIRIGTEGDFDDLPGVPRYGCDFGFAVDPVVLLEAYVGNRKLLITREAYKIGCEIDDTPALFKKHVPGAEKYRIKADGARPETISYMRRFGYPLMMAATKGTGSVKEGIEFLKNYDIIIHPRCTYAIDEFMNYCYKVDRLTGEVLPELQDEKNHTIDAARYLVEDLRRAKMGVF